MVRLVCRHCRFNYIPKTQIASVPKTCGNCGHNNTLEKEPDAADILNQV